MKHGIRTGLLLCLAATLANAPAAAQEKPKETKPAAFRSIKMVMTGGQGPDVLTAVDGKGRIQHAVNMGGENNKPDKLQLTPEMLEKLHAAVAAVDWGKLQKKYVNTDGQDMANYDVTFTDAAGKVFRAQIENFSEDGRAPKTLLDLVSLVERQVRTLKESRENDGGDNKAQTQPAEFKAIALRQTGGFAGVNNVIHLSGGGDWTYESRKADSRKKGRLPAAAMEKVNADVAVMDWSAIKNRYENNRGADMFTYEIEVTDADGKAHGSIVQNFEINADAPKELKALISTVSDLVQHAARDAGR